MITEAWIEKVSRVLHNSEDGLCDEDVRALHDLRKAVLPIPGAVEKEVPGEVKREALAQDAVRATLEARKNVVRANTAQLVTERKLSEAEEFARAQHEKRNNNFRAFINFMAAIDPFSTERMAELLTHARTPVRYQAWGRLSRNVALWTAASHGADLADLNKEYCSAPDRIELVDTIGFCPGYLSSHVCDRIHEEYAIEIQRHGVERSNIGHLPFELLCRDKGMRLEGAGRPIILPRASVPVLRLNCDVPGWLFVEGWRVSLG